MENLWQRLQNVTSAQPTMAKMLGLVQNRLEAANNLNEYTIEENRLNEELRMRLAHLQKICQQRT